MADSQTCMSNGERYRAVSPAFKHTFRVTFYVFRSRFKPGSNRLVDTCSVIVLLLFIARYVSFAWASRLAIIGHNVTTLLSRYVDNWISAAHDDTGASPFDL